MVGPVDGAGEYQGHPFLGGGSTGYPDAAIVLRSYFSHPGLEILRLSMDLAKVGDVVLGEPDPFAPDSLSFEVKTAGGDRCTGIDSYGQAIDEGAAFASRHGITAGEGLQGALLDGRRRPGSRRDRYRSSPTGAGRTVTCWDPAASPVQPGRRSAGPATAIRSRAAIALRYEIDAILHGPADC